MRQSTKLDSLGLATTTIDIVDGIVLIVVVVAVVVVLVAVVIVVMAIILSSRISFNFLLFVCASSVIQSFVYIFLIV